MSPDTTSGPSAAAIAGLLADEDRRRVLAALVLGAGDLASVATLAGLDGARTGKAVQRLVSGGLVARGDGGGLVLREAVFGAAARAAAQEAAVRAAAAPDPVLEGVDRDRAKVLRAFVRDGRLVQIPTQRSKRMVVLELLAQEFEPGRYYSEPMVNLILGRWHADTATLRRYLVDEGLLDRGMGVYWRTGGTVDVDRAGGPPPPPPVNA